MRPTRPQSPKPPGNKGLIILAGLIAVGAVAFLVARSKVKSAPEMDPKRPIDPNGVFSGGVTPTKTSPKAFETLGEFAADAALKILGAGGHLIVVRETPGPDSLRDATRFFDMLEEESKSFKGRLNSKGKFTFQRDHTLVRPSGAQRAVWPAGELAKLLQKHPAATTIVAFCHLPEAMSETDKAMLRGRSGKVIVVGGMVPEMQPLVRAGLVHLAVSQRMPAPSSPVGGTESPSEWVQRVYQVLKSGDMQ